MWRAGRIVLRVALCLVALAAVLAATVAGVAIRKAGVAVDDVPALSDPSRAPLPQPIVFYSADGHRLGAIDVAKREVVNAKQIPGVLNDAVVAIEDQRFFEHDGVDVQAVLRAAWVDLRHKSARQGASTITMQYARNVYLDFRKTANRKLQEAALALQIESMWPKSRILTAYLNTAYFANGYYGVQAASKGYFGRAAIDLTAAQAALLAGIVRDPSGYDPRRHPAAARQRRDLVLDEMYAQGYLTRKQTLAAKRSPVKVAPAPKHSVAPEPQLLEVAMGELDRTLDKVTRARGGLVVHTSLNLADIRDARRRLDAAYPAGGRRPAIAASFLDPSTGRVSVLASNRRDGSYEFASQARRQPGSVVKVFTAAQLIREGGQLTDRVDNSPLTVRDGKRRYTLQPTRDDVRDLQDALRWSQNPAFWRLYQQAGPKQVLALEKRLGLTEMDANPAAALGGVRHGTSTMQVAGAMGALADNGVYRRPHVLVTVTDTLGNRVWDDGNGQARRVLDAEHAKVVNQGLRNVVTGGFPQLRRSVSLARGREVAGKTGTTNDNADAWFAGYTPNLAGAVWTGFPDSRRPLRDIGQSGEVFGMTVPARAWNAIASDLLDGRPRERFARPLGVARIPDVVGDRLPDAQAKLARLRFGSVTYRSRQVGRDQAGRVLSISPPPGSWQRPATAVTVTYGLAQRPVPELVGKSYLDAVDEIGRFADVTVKLSPSEKPTGTVLEQEPYAGAMIDPGGKVTLTVATERAPAIVRIKKVEYVPSDSELARLREELRQARQAAEQPGTVMPDVTGLTAYRAKIVLRSLGVRVAVNGSGEVVSQSPQPGERVSAGQIVVLGVSDDG